MIRGEERIYLCFGSGLFEDVDVELEVMDFSSSRWTATEKRFQNAGSRIAAIVDGCREDKVDRLGVGQWGRCVKVVETEGDHRRFLVNS